jgi:hypothetical protein
LSSRAYPDFLLHRSHRRPLMSFSLKRTTCSSPKPQFSTGNPGEPRDLRFHGPFVDMFFGSHTPSLAPEGTSCARFQIPSMAGAAADLPREQDWLHRSAAARW